MLSRLLSLSAGFLMAVLWFDLMFDVQVLHFAAGEPIPESVLASNAAYYRRVTTDAFPMNRVVAAAMITTVGASVWQVYRCRRFIAVVALLLCAAPVALAARRVLPNAVALGARAGTPARQAELARGICLDHLLCLGAIVAFAGIQLSGTLTRRKQR